MGDHADLAPLPFATIFGLFETKRRLATVTSALREMDEAGKHRDRLLRHHFAGTVGYRSTLIRDDLDFLLAAAGMIEIATLWSEPTSEMPPLGRKLLRLLADPAVAKYYLLTYPLTTPVIFMARATAALPQSYLSACAADRERATSPLAQILALEQQRLNNDDLQFFMGLLDGYYDQVDLHDVLESLKSPRVVAQLTLVKGGQTRADKMLRSGMRGLFDFLRFAQDLLQLLVRLEGTQTGALLWLHYAYWFGHGGEAIDDAGDLLKKRIDGWISKGNNDQKRAVVLAQEIAREAARALHALRDASRWTASLDPGLLQSLRFIPGRVLL